MFVIAAAVLLLAAVISVMVVAPTDSSPAEAVVASSGSVALIDPKANRVVAAIHVGDRPTRVAVREDAIWVLHPDIRTLSLLSRTERKVVRTVGLGGAPSALAVDEHGVWVSDARAASVTLIEPERLTVVRTVRTRQQPPLPGPYTGARTARDRIRVTLVCLGREHDHADRCGDGPGDDANPPRRHRRGAGWNRDRRGISPGRRPLSGVDGDANRSESEQDRRNDPHPEVPAERDREWGRRSLGLGCGQ